MNIIKKFVPLFILIILALGFLTPVADCQAGLLATSSGVTQQTDALTSRAGFDTSTRFEDIVALIIRVVLSLLGIIFLVLLILGGYQWMTAGGDEKQVEGAQARIKTAVIGLVIVLSAYAITAFVFTRLPYNAAVPQTDSGQGNAPE